MFGRGVTASANSEGAADFLTSGVLSRDILDSADMRINVSLSEALRIAEGYHAGSFPAASGDAVLVVWSLGEYETSPVYAYLAGIEGVNDAGEYISENVAVNASSGGVMGSVSNIHYATAPSTLWVQAEDELTEGTGALKSFRVSL